MARDKDTLINYIRSEGNGLAEAAYTYAERAWIGKRSELANIANLYDFVAYVWSHTFPVTAECCDLKQSDVDSYLEYYRSQGFSSSTLNTKGSVIAGFIKAVRMDDRIKVKFYGRPTVRKWSLTDAEYNLLTSALSHSTMRLDGGNSNSSGISNNALMQAYIVFTVETGLRVEEVLRLVPSDFDLTDPKRPVLFVPGTKNTQSEARIAISALAGYWADLLIYRATRYTQSKRLFDVPYRKLWDWWDVCREYLGLQDEPTATLKGLRRTFAARCLRKGIPIEMIRELMRHSSLDTTLSYLRQFGLSDNDETRALLNKQLGATTVDYWEKLPNGFGDGVGVRRIRGLE